MVIFREKLEKLSWGWAEGINDWNSPWESALSLPCGDIYALSSNPNPIVHGGTFLILVDLLVRRELEVPACFNRKKRRGLARFVFWSEDKVHVHLFASWTLRLLPPRKRNVVAESQRLICVVADFARRDLKRGERNVCKLRRVREVVVRVEIEVQSGSDSRCMHSLEEQC